MSSSVWELLACSHPGLSGQPRAGKASLATCHPGWCKREERGDSLVVQWLKLHSGGLRPLVELCVEPAGLCGRCTRVSVPLRVVPSSTGFPSKRCAGIGFFSRVDRLIGVFRHVAPPTRLRLDPILNPPPSPFHPSGSSQCTSAKIRYRASNLDWQLVSYMIFYLPPIPPSISLFQ